MRYFFLFLLLVSQSVFAQTSEKYHNTDAIFYRGEDLFLKDQFGSAREVFHQYTQKSKETNAPLHIKARYYEALSALKLFNNDAVSMLLQFLEDYPETIYRKKIYQEIGNYYFQKNDYDEVIVWFSKLDKEDVPKEEQASFFFKLGYSNFQESNMKAARDAFYEVKDTKTEYAVPATYYFAHICYAEKSYQLALEHFNRLLKDGRFKELVPYYITQIYYLQGNYEKVVAFAPTIVDSVKVNGDAEINHMIGDAYYKIGEYDEAVAYLKRYHQLAPTTRQDDYQLGYAYFKSQNYKAAVKEFNRVAMTKDTLGQTALYHIGQCFLQMKEYASARDAFESAAMLDFDKEIQEDALYRSAIMSYKLDVNPYNEAIEAFQLYLKRYPNSPRKDEVYAYLVNVYASTKNYQAALDAIEKVENKDIRLRGAYQLVAYNKAVDEYTKSNFNQAMNTFQLVSKYPVDPKLVAQSTYWTADAAFHLKDYNKAIATYREFLAGEGSMFSTLKANAYYNMAYAYFYLKDMAQAATTFRIFVQEIAADSDKKADAFLRIGDAYYLSSHKDPSLVLPAIDFYQKAIDTKKGAEDRALFYQSKCYGFLDNREKQVACLSNIINNYSHSPYIIKAIFEVAIISRNENKDAEAARYFEQIIHDYPNNVLAVESLYELGVTYLKMNDFTNAERCLNQVLIEHGNNANMCKKASSKMLELYRKSNQLDKINNLAATYPCAKISNDLQDSIYFNVAYDFYLDSNYAKAITQFNRYLTNYPDGLLKYNAYYCLANSYYRTNKLDDAYQNYLKVLEGPNRADYETALARTANYEYNKKEYGKAVEHYARLATSASSPGRIYVAHLGLMRCNFLLENWADASQEAKIVWENGLSSKSDKLEAKFTEGITASKLERWDETFAPLIYVCENAKNIMASQAAYTIALAYYSKNEYEKSSNQIRILLKMKPAYDFWVAKGLILQSRISIATDDLFQAEYTLKSIIDNYKIQDDGILEEANTLMAEIQQLKMEPEPAVDSTQRIIEINATEGGQKP